MAFVGSADGGGLGANGAARSARERDPLRDRPALPPSVGAAMGGRTGAAESLTWRRVNRAVVAIRRLAVCAMPTLSELLPGPRGCTEEWDLAAPPQRRIVTNLWSRHQDRADWGSVTDGRAALRRLGNGKVLGPYGQAQGTGSTIDKGKLGRGDVCPLVPEEVDLPPPGAKPVPVVQISRSARPFPEKAEILMMKPDGKVDCEAGRSNRGCSHASPSLASSGWRWP